jgi:hypothetical protein
MMLDRASKMGLTYNLFHSQLYPIILTELLKEDPQPFLIHEQGVKYALTTAPFLITHHSQLSGNISPSKYENIAFNLPMLASFYVLINSLVFPFDNTCCELHTVLNR